MINVTNSDQEKILVEAILKNSLHDGLLVYEFSEKISFQDAIESCSQLHKYNIYGWRLPSTSELVKLKGGESAKSILDTVKDFWSFSPVVWKTLYKTDDINSYLMNTCYRDKNKFLLAVNDIFKKE
jgi:hypothetical protein